MADTHPGQAKLTDSVSKLFGNLPVQVKVSEEHTGHPSVTKDGDNHIITVSKSHLDEMDKSDKSDPLNRVHLGILKNIVENHGVSFDDLKNHLKESGLTKISLKGTGDSPSVDRKKALLSVKGTDGLKAFIKEQKAAIKEKNYPQRADSNNMEKAIQYFTSQNQTKYSEPANMLLNSLRNLVKDRELHGSTQFNSLGTNLNSRVNKIISFFKHHLAKENKDKHKIGREAFFKFTSPKTDNASILKLLSQIGKHKG